jgi:aminoethylphosphonate catabolism LysR family transcriptional regulator
MAISFTLLRTFHAVAEKRGFTLAADFLGIGQPTVTTQIQELERGYKVELFSRKGRRVELTEAGEALFAITKRLVGLRDEAEEILVTHGQLDAGHLRLAAVGPFHATEIIARFKRRFPGANVSVVLGNSEQTLRRVLDLEADVGLLAQTTNDPRIHSTPYRQHRVVVFVNRTHPWFRSRQRVKLTELAGQPFVLREQGSTTRRAFEAALSKAGVSIQPTFEIGSREGVWKAVEQGLGISVVSDFEFVPHPNLRTVEIEDCVVRTEYQIVSLRERKDSQKIQAFIQVARDLTSDVQPKQQQHRKTKPAVAKRGL